MTDCTEPHFRDPTAEAAREGQEGITKAAQL